MDTVNETDFVPESDDNVVTIPAGDPQLLPERRFIPEPAREEIMKLFNVFLDFTKKAGTAREAFTTFMNTVRRELGIPDNEQWNPSDEATYFEKQAGPVPPAGMTAEFVPDGGVPSP